VSFATVQAALDACLATVPGIPPIQLENTANAPKTGVAFSRGTLIPSRTNAPTVGPGATELNGLYQVDLFYPTNTGTATSNAMVEAVIAKFPSHTTLPVRDGLTVLIDVAWREAAQRDMTFMNTPVVVSWSCWRPN
jgi:hypothetical protein